MATAPEIAEALDSLATAWLEAAAPIELRPAAPRELEAVFRLRYRAVIAEGWAVPDEFPDGLERSEDDDHAVQVVGLSGPELAATSRLVLPGDGRRLPAERFFDVALDPDARLVELDRIVVAPPYRERGHRIFAGLLGQSWRELRARGYEGLVGIVSEPLLERYEGLGLRFARLAPVRPYFGEERFPVLLDARATAGACGL